MSMTVEAFDLLCQEFLLDWHIDRSAVHGYVVKVERVLHRLGDSEPFFSLEVDDLTLGGALAKAAAHIQMRLGKGKKANE